MSKSLLKCKDCGNTNMFEEITTGTSRYKFFQDDQGRIIRTDEVEHLDTTELEYICGKCGATMEETEEGDDFGSELVDRWGEEGETVDG